MGPREESQPVFVVRLTDCINVVSLQEVAGGRPPAVKGQRV